MMTSVVQRTRVADFEAILARAVARLPSGGGSFDETSGSSSKEDPAEAASETAGQVHGLIVGRQDPSETTAPDDASSAGDTPPREAAPTATVATLYLYPKRADRAVKRAIAADTADESAVVVTSALLFKKTGVP
mmetsp:Transcript_22811/g.90480  ORF Transcript_22811/g.90480 Transcript_22811/m.90480 type:complete len:134 (-) Transcript_22811:2263-2664(-)